MEAEMSTDRAETKALDGRAAARPDRMTAASLAKMVSGDLNGRDDLVIKGVNSLERAVEGEVTFIGDAKHAGRWEKSKASAALVTRGVEVPHHDPEARALIVVENADLAMARVLEHFASPLPSPAMGIHPRACVDPSAQLGEHVRIGALAYIGPEARIGNGVTIHPGATVMDQAIIGDDSIIWPGAVVRERSILGKRVVLHSGAVIGADGFGYRPLPDGKGIKHIPHIGHVEIGDYVEIGANSAIDRGTFDATRVGAGTKIDNLVQIGHNCQIGRMCMICGQVGLAGSVTVGDGVIMGGNVGVADHLTIGAGARLAARSGVIENVPAGETWAGAPARPHRDFFRLLAIERRMLGENRRR